MIAAMRVEMMGDNTDASPAETGCVYTRNRLLLQAFSRNATPVTARTSRRARPILFDLCSGHQVSSHPDTSSPCEVGDAQQPLLENGRVKVQHCRHEYQTNDS